MSMTHKCAQCGKVGPLAEDQTDPAADELACDTRRLVAPNEYVCGECLEQAEDTAQSSVTCDRA